MDTEKLFKAIQIVVKEEVKTQLTLIKEEIRKEVLSEVKSLLGHQLPYTQTKVRALELDQLEL
jgi:FAD synthase